jgi:hypothetical protein
MIEATRIEATRENTTPGTVLQISPHADVNKYLLGCLMVAEEIRSWGVQGYVQQAEGRAYVRVGWADLAWIGQAYWLDEDVLDVLVFADPTDDDIDLLGDAEP